MASHPALNRLNMASSILSLPMQALIMTRVPILFLLAVLAAILAGAGVASAQAVYKYVMPDGRVIYSDQPIKGANQTKAVELPPPPTEADRAAAQQRNADDARKRRELQGRLDDRRNKLDLADVRVAAARKGLEAAERALEAGREPLPGERSGNVGATSRLNEGYFQRVAGLEKAVADARQEIDDALKERNQAR